MAKRPRLAKAQKGVLAAAVSRHLGWNGERGISRIKTVLRGGPPRRHARKISWEELVALYPFLRRTPNRKRDLYLKWAQKGGLPPLRWPFSDYPGASMRLAAWLAANGIEKVGDILRADFDHRTLKGIAQLMNRSLLQRIADGESTFGRKEVHSEADGAAFDALVRDLFALEAGGYITMALPVLQRMTSHGRCYAAGPCVITPTGLEALRK